MSTGRLAVTCPVVVGRDDVLGVLATHARTAGDRGVVTLLGGGPGLGKTRLLGEAVRLADAHGHLVLTGECRQEAVGYEPFTSALGRYERTLLEAETELLFSGRARAARVLLPTVFSDTPPAADTPTHLQAALVELLRRLAAWKPVTLLLEDLQWARRDALELLLGVAAEVPDLPVWVVGTFRPSELVAPEPFAQLVTLVERRHPDEQLVLDPLDVDGVAAMLAGAFPRRHFDAAFVAALHDRSGGAPFVVEELCRALLDRGQLDAAHGHEVVTALDLPDTVSTALLGRLDRVSDPTRDLLAAAAVAGEELDLDLLRAATGQSHEQQRSAIIEALDLQLLSEHRDGPLPYYAFTHALTRDAIRSSLPGPARQVRHERLARALAAREGEAAAELVCDHLVAAGCGDEAAPWALAAARRAAVRLQPREAARRFEEAIELAHDGPTQVRVAVEAAEFGFYADRPAAVPLAERARRLSQAEGDVVHEVRALVVLARTRWITGDPDAFAPFERALGLVEQRGDPLELTVLIEAAYHLARTGWLDDAHRADALLRHAGGLADTIDDAGLRARLALASAARCTDRDDLLEACRRAAALLARAGNPWAEATADLLAGHHLVLFHGDLREGARRLRRHQRVSDELTTRRPSVPFSGLALATLWMGDSAAARALLAEGYWGDSDLSAANWHEGMAELALARGQVSEALTHARAGLALVEEGDEPAWVLPALGALGRAQLEADGLAVATPTLERALAHVARSNLSHHWPFSPAWARALVAAHRVDDLARVTEVLEGATAAAGARGQDVAALRYVQGLRAATNDQFDAAADAFDEAATRYAAMPFPSRTVGVRLVWARTDHRAGRTDDAVARAREALVLAQALDRPLLVERVLTVLAAFGPDGRRATPAAGAAALTAREREIVQLTVAGLTARDIGERLVISHRTVEGHLERARGKLGATSKADLVRLAIEAGL